MGRPRKGKRRAAWWLQPAELVEPSSPAERKLRARFLKLAESLHLPESSSPAEREQLRERFVAHLERERAKRSVPITAGMRRAKEAGRRPGPREKLSEAEQEAVKSRLTPPPGEKRGEKMQSVADEFHVGLATIDRIKKKKGRRPTVEPSSPTKPEQLSPSDSSSQERDWLDF